MEAAIYSENCNSIWLLIFTGVEGTETGGSLVPSILDPLRLILTSMSDIAMDILADEWEANDIERVGKGKHNPWNICSIL